MSQSQTLIRNIPHTFLNIIQKSVGSTLFQNFYCYVGEEEKDVMKGGQLSCAFYVSSITTIFGLTKEIHGTVTGTIHDIEKSGWEKISLESLCLTGDVIVWEKKFVNDSEHEHIGFYIGNEEAISNSSEQKVIARHHWTYNGTRKITHIYRHPIFASYHKKHIP